MPFAYYARLSSRQKLIYRQSDAVPAISLPRPQSVHERILTLRAALAEEDRPRVERNCQDLANQIFDQLGVSRTRVTVLAVRPARRWGELHGLYDPTHGEGDVTISLWMRTARQKRVVAMRTFLRTLLHEVCHHLDYQYLKLADSFHTEGFYKRESSLFRQIWPDEGPDEVPDEEPEGGQEEGPQGQAESEDARRPRR
jgi:hypothetical protein